MGLAFLFWAILVEVVQKPQLRDEPSDAYATPLHLAPVEQLAYLLARVPVNAATLSGVIM